MRRIPRLENLVPALALALAVACSVDSPSPAGGALVTVDEAGLLALARPSGDEKAVLLNFWTTW